MSLINVLFIGIGGFFGAISRHLVSSGVSRLLGIDFPLGTLTVNAVGSLSLGFLTHYLLYHLVVSDVIRVAVLVGFLGAFTTFSTFSIQTVILIQNGDLIKAGLNVLINCLSCIVLCFIGMQLAKVL